MKLLLDIGNTRIKWAFATPGANELTGRGEWVHRGADGLDAFAEQLEQQPDSAAAVNVAGVEVGETLTDVLQRNFGCDLQLIRTTASFGDVSNGYVSPEQLGADRWAAVVAAWARYHGACCIVDAGSATTIDLLASTGKHLGGIILPGLQLMQAALRADTSDIDAFARQGKLLTDAGWAGRDTASAIRRGSLFATIQAIEGAVREFPEAGQAPRLILTGGDAPILARDLPASAEQLELLVLEGVQLLSLGQN